MYHGVVGAALQLSRGQTTAERSAAEAVVSVHEERFGKAPDQVSAANRNVHSERAAFKLDKHLDKQI